jgi:hypothetical protein
MIRFADSRSGPEMEQEFRRCMNMFHSELIKHGVAHSLVAGPFSVIDDDSKRWVASELLRLFVMFAERRENIQDMIKHNYELLNGDSGRRLIEGSRAITTAG